MNVPCDSCYRSKSCREECPAFLMFTDEEKTRKRINPIPCGSCAARLICRNPCSSFRTWEKTGV